MGLRTWLCAAPAPARVLRFGHVPGEANRSCACCPARPLSQAIARLFRYGQRQETAVYRLYANGAVQYNVYLR